MKLNGNYIIAILFILCIMKRNEIFAQGAENLVFKSEHLLFDTTLGDIETTVFLYKEYALCLSNKSDTIFLIPYKIIATNEENLYCFDFPYGNPKWDFKNMILRKGEIFDLKKIKQQKELLSYVQLRNVALYNNKINSKDSLKVDLFKKGLLLKEGIKKVRILNNKTIVFEPYTPSY